MEFTVYASWRTQAPVLDGELETFSRVFLPGDESVCVWISKDDPSVLEVALDAEDATPKDAFTRTRDLVSAAASLGNLAGAVVSCTIYVREDEDSGTMASDEYWEYRA